MCNFEIIQLIPENYQRCSNIWDMGKKPEMAKRFYDELVSGNRIIYIYADDDWLNAYFSFSGCSDKVKMMTAKQILDSVK